MDCFISMILAVVFVGWFVFSSMTFISLRKVSSMPSLLGVFIMKGVGFLSDDFL